MIVQEESNIPCERKGNARRCEEEEELDARRGREPEWRVCKKSNQENKVEKGDVPIIGSEECEGAYR